MTKPEFSRLVRLGPEPREVALEASEAERTALAARFGILGIGALSATLRLQPEPGGSIRARGRLAAEVDQACVVTLEPVRQAVSAPIDLRILGEGESPADEDPESPDEIESARAAFPRPRPLSAGGRGGTARPRPAGGAGARAGAEAQPLRKACETARRVARAAVGRGWPLAAPRRGW